MFVIICGAGRVGSSLAKRLVGEKHKVVVVDRDTANCESVAEEMEDVIIIHGDACEPKYLEEANAEKADVVVAVTNDDEDNLVICQLAKLYFSVPRTVARVNDPRNQEAFAKLGVDVPIDATTIISQALNQEVSLEELSTLLKLKQGKISVVHGTISDESPLLRHPLKEIAIPSGCIIASVVRRDDVIVPNGETVLENGDDILAITTPENEREFYRLIRGA